MSRRGFTVPEILVTLGLLFLMLSVALATLLAYSRAYKSLADERPNFIRASQGLLRLTQVLRSSRIVSPSPEELRRGFSPGSSMLVVEHPSEGTLGYRFDAAALAIREVRLDLEAQPTRTIGEAEGLHLRLEGQLLTLTLAGKAPLETVVRLR